MMLCENVEELNRIEDKARELARAKGYNSLWSMPRHQREKFREQAKEILNVS